MPSDTAPSTAPAQAKAVAAPPPKRSRRRGLFIILGLVLVVGAVAYGVYYFTVSQFYESTDDAYVGGNIVAVTSRENATLMSLHVDNTQSVKRGDILLEMDPSTAKVNLDAAEANLARVVRSTRGNFSSADTFRAQLAQAQVNLAATQNDYKRRQAAVGIGAVSTEELAHAHDAVQAAEAAVNAAKSGLDRALTQVEGTDVAGNPDVLSAEAMLRNAVIAYSHMRIVAPVDGVIAQRTVQVGQQVAAGTPLMAVVPLSHVWIDANFKEVQLENMRVGQPVTVVADVYGSDVTYHGRVEGLGAGSGSAFALLPPQNASGNWIKIVQRVPVRIALDPKELKDHPLRVGLSATVTVDLHDTSGPVMTGSVADDTMTGDVGEDTTADADARIARILAENGAKK